MAESTLRKWMKRSEPATKLGRYEATFSEEVEADFCQYLKVLDDMYFGMTAKSLRGLAFEFALANNIPHRFNRETKLAGKDWLRGFLSRHPDISLRQPTATSVARAMGFNKPQVERVYINLSALQDKYNFPPHRVFNMDETGITTVPNKPPKVLSSKGKRSVSKISSAERGVNIVNAMSATGIYVPPVFIFGRKRMKAELLDGAPPGSIGMVSDSSYINSDLFMEWLTHFKDHTKPTRESPVLLTLDNHVSHCTISAINFYRKNHIIALTLPPHASHKMQPLDLKKYYANECEKWLRNHSGRVITVFQMVRFFTPAYLKTATLACAIQSLKVTGIVPYDPDVFSEADFLASSVTDREPEGNNDNYVQSTSRDSEALPTTSIEPVLQTSASTSIDKLCSKLVAEICPLPKAQGRRTSDRKHKKSEIISSSPYKAEVEKQIKIKIKPTLKIHTKETQSSKTNEKAKKGPKEFKKPNRTPKRKIWRCGGCQKTYKEPIVEDWIECSECKEWWHEKCTAYIGGGLYQCDLWVNN